MKFERFECLAGGCEEQITINSSQHFDKYHGKSLQNLIAEEHGDRILELHQEGLSIKDVAEELGISYISKETVGNHPSNLITVCRDCHYKRHRNLGRKEIIQNKIRLLSGVPA